MNACLTAAGAFRPTDNRTRVTGVKQKIMARRQMARLEIAKRKMLAQMNGHRADTIPGKNKIPIL
ncbi:hypothetical protein GIR22_10865 [Pseudomonas sp. CCM 7891]|uniref:Uncharacterized protein n=1 Tax=Pseudomonas karstica TaxID=1055468 RepID=A0A7X2RTF3_9PSED|nr:hypothetical protein [Pseudomonas karstica]MTD19627.1 hypothetical protein [Pseudomonas karstica]